MCFSKLFKKKKAAPKTDYVQQKPSAPAFKVMTFTFQELPNSLDELMALPEANLDSPFKTAALTMLALCAYAKDPKAGGEMLNFLRGPRPLTQMDLQFLKDRFMDDGKYVPFSYFKGATPATNYTPDKPYVLKISEGQYSYREEGYAILHLTSGGADSPRQIKLRKKPSTGEWFLWDQMVMVSIKPRNEANPWA